MSRRRFGFDFATLPGATAVKLRSVLEKTQRRCCVRIEVVGEDWLVACGDPGCEELTTLIEKPLAVTAKP